MEKLGCDNFISGVEFFTLEMKFIFCKSKLFSHLNLFWGVWSKMENWVVGFVLKYMGLFWKIDARRFSERGPYIYSNS